MKYTTKNPLINQMTLSSVDYTKFIPLTAKFATKELGQEVTEEEVSQIIEFMFNDAIDWIYNPNTSSAYALEGLLTLHVNYFSVNMRISKLVTIAKKLRDKSDKSDYDLLKLSLLKKKINRLWKKRDLAIHYPYPRLYNIRKNTRKYVTQFDNIRRKKKTQSEDDI
jgi:deoxyribodipyrimidine photolyase-like uncharacterized protein